MYNVAIAYLLWLFSGCGALGFHRFYLGKIPSGLLWMFTGGLGLVGAFYDFFIERRDACTLRKRTSSPGPRHTLEEIYLKHRIIMELR